MSMIPKTDVKEDVFQWSDVGSHHLSLQDRNFYGQMSLRYEKGQVVLIRVEETIKPTKRM